MILQYILMIDRQQHVINWTNVYQVLGRHMPSLGTNELNMKIGRFLLVL